MTQPVYDAIGRGYRRQRLSDPRIATAIRTAIGDAKTVCNVGAGAGSYEPHDCRVTAVEPSERMIAQRTSTAPVVRGFAEDLPFADQEFDASLAVLTVHHWSDPQRGLSEMRRVSRRQVILTFDLETACAFWLVREYLPEAERLDRDRTLSIDQMKAALNASDVRTVPVPHDCVDGFQGAFWRRPEEYLKPHVRAAISTFAQLPPAVVDRAVRQLRDDLQSGVWRRRHADLLQRSELDVGYRLVVAEANA